MTVLLSACTSDKILETLNIGYSPAKEQVSADQKKIRSLKKQLVAAEKNEAEQNDQIEKLKKELIEQELTISIQGKIIGLLDDTDQTLQKSIEKQIREKSPNLHY